MTTSHYQSQMRGIVFDIERSATHDGPGIRTAVFLKGCYLHCAWCHNPESIDPRPELMYYASRCIADLACYRACPTEALWFEDANGERLARDAQVQSEQIASIRRCYNIDLCQRCGACADVCYAQALEFVGKEMSVRHVFDQIALDRAFYTASGGGVTITGGEPLYQADFAQNLLIMCQANGIHTALDTTGFGPWERLHQVSTSADLVLLDLKHMDDEQHRRYTGVSNKSILENATRLASERANARDENEGIWIRIPIIPGINDSEENISSTAHFVQENMLPAVQAVELLGYHKLGVEKRTRLGQDYLLDDIKAPSPQHMAELASLIRDTLQNSNVRISYR